MAAKFNVAIRSEVRLDNKWLKTDLQRALCRDGLADLWNEMVRDGEIVGSFSDGLINSAGVTSRKGEFVDERLEEILAKEIELGLYYFYCYIRFRLNRKVLYVSGDSGHYYCNLRVLSCLCCDGICGPQNGCNCGPCQKIDAEEAGINATLTEKTVPAQNLIDSWIWGPQPCELRIARIILILQRFE